MGLVDLGEAWVSARSKVHWNIILKYGRHVDGLKTTTVKMRHPL